MGQLTRAWDAVVEAVERGGDVDAARAAYDRVVRAYASDALWDALGDVLEHGDPVTVAWVRAEVRRWAGEA